MAVTPQTTGIAQRKASVAHMAGVLDAQSTLMPVSLAIVAQRGVSAAMNAAKS